MLIRSRGRAACAMTFATVCVLVGGPGTPGSPALAQDLLPVPTLEPTAISTLERRDLYLDMPFYLGGFEPDIVMTRGAEHFANLDPAQADDAETIADLEGLFEATGASIEDMTSGYALVLQEDFFAFVVAVRIDGAAPGTLLPAYLPILLAGLLDPTTEPGTLGGKDILVISSEGSNGDYVDLYVYDAGETVWLVQGPEDVVEQALTALPLAARPI